MARQAEIKKRAGKHARGGPRRRCFQIPLTEEEKATLLEAAQLIRPDRSLAGFIRDAALSAANLLKTRSK